MTVFNHFARKEDMFFDLDEQARQDLLAALEHRDPSMPPVEALRLFAHAAIASQRLYVQFFAPGSDRFMATIHASDSLKARARAIRDEMTDTLTGALAKSANRPLPDPHASLAASLLAASWTVALNESFRAFQQHHNVAKANATFLELIDRGAKGALSALSGTPYA